MRQLEYLAVFEPSKTGFSVYFPDLPGCISHGGNLEEAMNEARDALGLHLYGMEKDGDKIPEPSRVPSVDAETSPGYFIVPISINISHTSHLHE